MQKDHSPSRSVYLSYFLERAMVLILFTCLRKHFRFNTDHCPQLPEKADSISHSKHGYFAHRGQHCSQLHYRVGGAYSVWVRNLFVNGPYASVSMWNVSLSITTKPVVPRWWSCSVRLWKLWETGLTEESGCMGGGAGRMRYVLYPSPALSSVSCSAEMWTSQTCHHSCELFLLSWLFCCDGLYPFQPWVQQA